MPVPSRPRRSVRRSATTSTCSAKGDQAEVPAAQAQQQFADQLRTVASKVQVQPKATVDGVDAVHRSGRTDASGVTAVTDQYTSYVDGAYFIVTFSYRGETPAAQREQEVSSMLASCTWGLTRRTLEGPHRGARAAPCGSRRAADGARRAQAIRGRVGRRRVARALRSGAITDRCVPSSHDAIVATLDSPTSPGQT